MDVYGDKEKFGKQVGGDIVSNKKTYLLINALKLAKGEQKAELDKWINMGDFDNAEKVEAVTTIYNDLSIPEMTRSKINAYFEKGFNAFKTLEVEESRKKPILDFTNYLINREK